MKIWISIFVSFFAFTANIAFAQDPMVQSNNQHNQFATAYSARSGKIRGTTIWIFGPSAAALFANLTDTGFKDAKNDGETYAVVTLGDNPSCSQYKMKDKEGNLVAGDIRYQCSLFIGTDGEFIR